MHTLHPSLLCALLLPRLYGRKPRPDRRRRGRNACMTSILVRSSRSKPCGNTIRSCPAWAFFIRHNCTATAELQNLPLRNFETRGRGKNWVQKTVQNVECSPLRILCLLLDYCSSQHLPLQSFCLPVTPSRISFTTPVSVPHILIPLSRSNPVPAALCSALCTALCTLLQRFRGSCS